MIALAFPLRSARMQWVSTIRNMWLIEPTTKVLEVQVYITREGLSAGSTRSMFLRGFFFYPKIYATGLESIQLRCTYAESFFLLEGDKELR